MIALGLSMVAAPALSTRVQPMMYDLTPFGSGSNQDLRVENNSDRELPVELRVERRFIAADGNETRKPAEDDFLIFPPQGNLAPNSFQTFRVRYVGEPNIDKTRLYVITVAQLPLQTGSAPTGVQILVSLGTSVAVTPPQARPAIAVTGVTKDAKNPDLLNVTLANTGGAYARLYNGSLSISSGADRVVLDGATFRAALSQPLIEAQSTRTISLPIPATLKGRDLTAEYTYAPPSRL